MSTESEPLVREVDELRYEREKHTRLMPQDLIPVDFSIPEPNGFYTWRLLTPPEAQPPYANELFVILAEPVTFDEDGYYEVAVIVGKKPEMIRDLIFNQDGMCVVLDPDNLIDGKPEEIEIGYILGSTDPVDVEFGELVEQLEKTIASREPVTV